VKDGDELIATVYRSEADARAFVALPALIDLLREAATDEYGDTERYLGREWLTKARAALAQADGPKEQP
jgi:hypothetical protein